MQGQISGTGHLRGTMSTESLIGGQVVGMRGLKGDKGDKGDTGEQGERGYGITSIVYNADKTITITYADGETVTTDVLQGEKGDTGDKGDKGDTGSTGATGNGIASAVLNADYTLTLTFTDGTTYTTPSIRGQKGDTGDTGQQGEQGVQGETGNGISSITKTATVGKVDTYTITFADGTTTTFDVQNGEDGQGSGDMLKYDYDSNDDGKVNASDVADSVAWSGVTGKPEDYPPSSHTHDDRYYTENEVDTALLGKSNTGHTHTKSDVTDFAHNHDDRYYTETEADGKFALISAISDMATKTWVNAQGFITSLAGYATEAWVEAKGYLTYVLWSDISDRPDSLSDFTDDLGSSPTHTHDDRYYTENEVDTALSGKANTSHTHSEYVTKQDAELTLNNCTITDSGSALSVTSGASTDDGQLAQAVIDAFDYATAKEILEV